MSHTFGRNGCDGEYLLQSFVLYCPFGTRSHSSSSSNSSSPSSSSSWTRAQQKKVVKKGGGGPAKKAQAKYIIDCWQPVDDKVMDPEAFKKYLHDRIKINGKAGDLGTKVSITRDKSKLVVRAEMPFSKRYLKYLTKKYLQKEQLRDFLHVIATSKGAYELKYYKVSGNPEV